MVALVENMLVIYDLITTQGRSKMRTFLCILEIALRKEPERSVIALKGIQLKTLMGTSLTIFPRYI